MTMRRRSAVAITPRLVVLGATGIGALARGAAASDLDHGARRTDDATTAATARSRTADDTDLSRRRPRPTTHRRRRPAGDDAPTTTIVPIVTHAADIGVLSPVAVAAPVRVALPTSTSTAR